MQLNFSQMILPHIQVKEIKAKGRGVFTTHNIAVNTVIEISPVIVFPVKEVADAEKTLLYNYFFEWGTNKNKRALGMGYISMYNHSYTANCRYEMDYIANTITIIAVKPINNGDELCINYNAEPDNATPVWFDVK